jgi:hypothetical protein
MATRLGHGWRLLNWPLHCGEFVLIHHVEHHGLHDTKHRNPTYSHEPVFRCRRCLLTGYRETFDPDPHLRWLLDLP